MLRQITEFVHFDSAACAGLLAAVLTIAGTAGAQAGVISVNFSFSAPAYVGDPYDISGSFTFDDSLTGVINGTQFLSESLTLQQGGVGLPIVEDYLARFRWDIDNMAIRAPDDTINTAITALGTNAYFLDYDDSFGFSVYFYPGGSPSQESPGVFVARNTLAVGAPFSYAVAPVQAVPEPGTTGLMTLCLVALGFAAWRPARARRALSPSFA